TCVVPPATANIREVVVVEQAEIYRRFRVLAGDGIRSTMVMATDPPGALGNAVTTVRKLRDGLVDHLGDAAEAVEGPNEWARRPGEDGPPAPRRYQETLWR